MRVANLEPEQDKDVSQHEIAKAGPVVKARRIVDLWAEESVWVALLVASAEAPIHIDVPDEAVGGADDVD